SLRFDTMPSSPILQAWAKTVGPSPSICSLKRRPRPALASILRSVALRTSPFNSIARQDGVGYDGHGRVLQGTRRACGVNAIASGRSGHREDAESLVGCLRSNEALCFA